MEGIWTWKRTHKIKFNRNGSITSNCSFVSGYWKKVNLYTFYIEYLHSPGHIEKYYAQIVGESMIVYNTSGEKVFEESQNLKIHPYRSKYLYLKHRDID